jgi:hypothetical protein
VHLFRNTQIAQANHFYWPISLDRQAQYNLQTSSKWRTMNIRLQHNRKGSADKWRFNFALCVRQAVGGTPVCVAAGQKVSIKQVGGVINGSGQKGRNPRNWVAHFK